MSESVQAVLALLMIVGTIGSVLVFVNDRVDWAAFAGLLALALGSLAGLVWSLLRRDKVPDLLKSIPGPAFERDGFLFKVVPAPRRVVATWTCISRAATTGRARRLWCSSRRRASSWSDPTWPA